MANYVSKHTGAQIDAAVDKTGELEAKVTTLTEEKIGFDPTKQGLPIMYMWGDTTGEDKDNEVTLTYRFGEHSGTLKRKWQGSGSVGLGKELGAIQGDENNGKFNYTIKLDNAIVAKEKWGAQKKYCLKAYVADFSHMRDRLARLIWGQIAKNRASRTVRLYHSPNWGAVDGFPIVLIVNGEYRGLYSMNVPKDGWMLRMPTAGTTREAIVCAEVGATFKTPVTIGSGETFKIEYVSDENDSDWVQTSLNKIYEAVSTRSFSALEAAIDIDSAIDYMLEVVKCTGGDAMARNYLLYTEDGVKWAFIPYDADTWFGINWGGEGHVSDSYAPLILDFMETNGLMNMICTYAPERVVNRYRELRPKELSASNIVETLLDVAGEIPKAVYDAEVARWPGIKATATNNPLQMVDHIRAREAVVDEEMERFSAPVLKPKATWYDTTAAGAEMNTITDIRFDPDYVVTGEEDANWVCDKDNVGSIKAYRTGTIVTIKPTAHKHVKISTDSTYMFANDGTNASFSALARITGTEIFTANSGTLMQFACYRCNKLTTPVFIPRGVTNISRMYDSCWVLRSTYDIPNGVFYMNGTFASSGLFKLPEIPVSVLEIKDAFAGCPATNLPTSIPENVIDVANAFSLCYKASGFIEVRAKNLASYSGAFNLAARDTDGIVLVGPNTQLAELAATNTDGKVTVG